MAEKKRKTKEEFEHPIEEVRRLRHAYFSKFNYDLDKVYEDIKKTQAEYAHKLVDVDAIRKRKKPNHKKSITPWLLNLLL